MTSDRGTSGGAELELNTPVTPKSPGLNPNALEFLSTKTSTPGGTVDSGSSWEQQNDSGIANTTNNDFSFANGDISSDNKSDAGVFSPNTESPFQPDFPTYTDNQTFSDTNANVANKVDPMPAAPMGNLMLDSPTGYPTAETQNSYPAGTDTQQTQGQTYPGDTTTPMTGIQYAGGDNSAIQDGEMDGSLTGDQLRLRLKSQLESYFSRENLSSDTYLQSQMDADQYVPIATVANLDQIQKMTSDQQLIVDMLRESSFVQVDEKGEKVRPNLNRCIVILREIPNTTPVQEVQDVFSGENCPKFVSCEFAHNDNWYVTFDSDADAQRAYQYLREEVRTFQGKPIMARIKAKPLIRTYQPRNGYINKRFQQPQGVGPQMEVVTSAAAAPPQQQQFTPATQQPFTTLMPNVTQFSLNGQQAMPFYPPPNPLLPTWQASPTMLDPSMVLAMNGYQATQVKDYSPVTNRSPFPNMNRNNNGRPMSNTFSRNQKMHTNSQMNRDRINSNESLPPRLQHQHDRLNSVNNNLHKTSPRNADNSPISNNVPVYHNHGRRMDGGPHGGHMNHHGNHSNHGNQGGHSGPYHPHHHPQHLDHANNNGVPNSHSRGSSEPLSQRYSAPPKSYSNSYKNRRRRDEDGARPNRSNSSQSTSSSNNREQPGSGPTGGPPAPPGRPMPVDKFDYEPTSFPPLPGSGNNTASGEKYENKLSDVVKGTAKMAAVAKDSPAPRATPVVTAAPIIPQTTSVQTSMPVTNSWENKENRDMTTSSTSQGATLASSSLPVATSSSPCSAGAAVTTATAPTKSSSGTASSHHSVSASNVRSISKPQQEVAVTQPDSTKTSDKQQQQQQPVVQTQSSSNDDKTASVTAASVKLSYAQMVQKTKVAEVSASSLADGSDGGSDSDGGEVPLQQSNRANVTLKEQGQHVSQSSAKPTRGSIKDYSRKDSRESERDDSKREDFRKENDYRRGDEQPREQRTGNRRAKENRERRFGDRDNWRRGDRRDRDGPREGPRTAVAK